MSLNSALLDRFTGQSGNEPIFLPDLTSWYRQAQRQGALPQQYADASLPDIYRDLGLPIWQVVRPWRVDLLGIDGVEEVTESQRIRTVNTNAGPLVSQWDLLADGAWRQTKYPVASAADLPAAVEWSRAIEYVLETEGLTEREIAIGDDGLLAIELPPRPLMQIVQELIGWGDGLALLNEPAIEHITEHLDQRLQALVTALAQLSVQVQYSPDCLDDTVISQDLFQQYLLPSYLESKEEFTLYRKILVVQARNQINAFVPLLIEAGIDCVGGVQGPFEGAAGLAELHDTVGSQLTLWGGIASDLLQPQTDQATFEQIIQQTARLAQDRRRLILGIVGPMSMDTDLSRLAAIPDLISQALDANS